MLAVLVVGLLRSHADILRALHRLGAGVGDPAAATADAGAQRSEAGAAPAPLLMGPPLPGERSSSSAPDLVGVTPSGDGKAVRVTGVDHRTLLVFLSSGCATCAGIWAALADPPAAGLPGEVRIVAVTKGPEFEISAEVARRAPPGLPVVMSTAAWGDYEVPGSPVLRPRGRADGSPGRGGGGEPAQPGRRARPPGQHRRRAALTVEHAGSGVRCRSEWQGSGDPERRRAGCLRGLAR